IQESGIVLSTLAEAPIVHLKLAEPSGDRFEDEKTLQAIVDEALEQGMRCPPILPSSPDHAPNIDHHRPSSLLLLLLLAGILLTRSQYVHSEKFLPPPSI